MRNKTQTQSGGPYGDLVYRAALPEILFEEDVRRLLGVDSIAEVRDLLEAGKIPGKCFEGKWYIRRQLFLNLLTPAHLIDEANRRGKSSRQMMHVVPSLDPNGGGS